MMVPVMSLWLPILLGAVLVFVGSSVIHMFLTYHQSDYSSVPSEDAVMESLRGFNIQPGDYVIPHAGSAKAMGTPEFLEKCNAGPIGFLTVVPTGPPRMGKSLGQWFVYSIIVGIFAAYITGHAVGPGASYLSVFRFSGAVAFACYAVALLQNSIWFGRGWSATLKSVFDGLIYALLTAGAFGWLWPDA